VNVGIHISQKQHSHPAAEQQRPSDALRAHASNRRSSQLIVPEPMEQQRSSALHTPSGSSNQMRQSGPCNLNICGLGSAEYIIF